jgi:hypothetical protein
MKTTDTISDFLSGLNKYPQAFEIAEASDYAQDKATEYARTLDADAVVEVNDGETYVRWDVQDEDGELAANVQTEFDEAFSEKILEMGYREHGEPHPIRYIDVPSEDWNDIHEQIANIDDDYEDADDVANAIQQGMKPDEYYNIEGAEGIYTVTKK